MMDLSVLGALVRQGESESLEFKQTTGERREGVCSLCAMLNHRGGHVLFGVSPDGKITGQQVSDRTIEEIVQEIQQIEPPVFPQIEHIEISHERKVISLTVASGSNRPYSYKGQAWKRVGNTSLKMSRDEYNRVLFERFHGERRWETEPAHNWTVSDLDLVEVNRSLDEAIRRGRMSDPGTRDPAQLLQGFGLTRNNQLLRAGIVLFGNQTRLEAEYPQCLLRVAKFKGANKTEFLDNRQFCGNAFYLLNRAEQFLRESLPIAGRVIPNLFERADDPLYPPVALREALANAFCHRDYSIGGGSVGVAVYDDRLEITSSGTLHFELTPEKLFEDHESLPWNPLIARVFHRRGIVESWGRGTINMVKLAEKAGQPRPEFEVTGGCVVVRFRPSRSYKPQNGNHNIEIQPSILQLLASNPAGLSRADIVNRLDLPALTVRDVLERLRSLGLVETYGRGRGAIWKSKK